MDNLAAHHAPEVRQLIEATGAKLLFTAPYYPEYSPIESAWHILNLRLEKLSIP